MAEVSEAEDFSVVQHPQTVEELFNYWFVLYNPLYLASALCVLTGVYFLSQGLGAMDWQQGKLLLTATIELYEILLVGSAVLLSRFANKRRSAVILAFIAAVFCLDATFQTEVMACFEGSRELLAVLWVLLAVGEMRLLAWTFKLRASVDAWFLLAAAASGIAFTPQLMDREGINPQVVHEGATWYFAALLAWLLLRRPKLTSEHPLDAWGLLVLERSRLTIGGIWTVVYMAHLLSWAVIHQVNLGIFHALPCLLMMMLSISFEGLVLGVSGVVLWIAYSTASPWIALLVALVLVWRAWREGWKRPLVGALLAFHVAIVTVGWNGDVWIMVIPWLNGALGVAILTVAWRLPLRDAFLSSGLALLVVDLPGWVRDPVTGGVGLLAAGFLALFAGVVIDWRRGGGRVRGLPRYDH